MVTDRPTRGVALGGASAAVGAVCQTVADHLATSRDVRPSVWRERGGRLRCVASTGHWPGRDGISPTAGVVGATFTSGVETVVPDAADRIDAAGDAADRTDAVGIVAQACLPIHLDGRVIGVLDVRLTRPLRAGDLERFRSAAADLGQRIEALGGPPAESAAQRMLRHMTNLSALDEPDAIARAVLAAALDLMELDSAVLVRPERAVAGADLESRPGDGPHAAVDGAPGPRAVATGPHDPTSAETTLHAVASIGPLGPALATAPTAVLETLARAAHDGAAGVVVATRQDVARSELTALNAAGARTLLAVGLVAHGERHGVLVLAGRNDHAVSIDDMELLELLGAHAATCLRTVDLMRTLRARA